MHSVPEHFEKRMKQILEGILSFECPFFKEGSASIFEAK
jgi:hypothetical protein